MQRRLAVAVQIVILSIVALSLYLSRDRLREVAILKPLRPSLPEVSRPEDEILRTNETLLEDVSPKNDSFIKVEGPLRPEKITAYVHSIANPEDTRLPRLGCPTVNLTRYEHLKTSKTYGHRYFFALDLRQCVSLLPRLMGSVLQTMRFLGPESCSLSVVEGNSNDGTGDVLDAMRAEVEAMGSTYFFRTTDIDPKKGGGPQRIVRLAELRNMALQPMVDDAKRYANGTVIFLNDVALCMDDILELVHQKVIQDADMTCAFDWTYVGENPTFYDVWVSRGMTGDSFFDIPADGSWDSAWNLFWNDWTTKTAYLEHRPFQVFSCWNGATAFTAAPILDGSVTFRAARDGECYQGEPQLFCKDLWHKGYRKIAVVPTINLEYSDERGKQIKDLKGYTSEWVEVEAGGEPYRIPWRHDPPEKVRCMDSWANQTWVSWDEYLE